MNIIILAAGNRINNNLNYPIYMTEINSTPLIHKQIEQMKALKKAKIIVAVDYEQDKKFHIEKIIKAIDPNIFVVSIYGSTKGALFSCLLCSDLLDLEEEMIVMSCNEYIQIDFNDFIKKSKDNNANAAIATFQSIHPRYSYINKDSEENIVQVTFNGPPTGIACSSLVWQKSAKKFIEECENAILKKIDFNEEFYFNEIINQFILSDQKIYDYGIKKGNYLPLKSKEQIAELQYYFREENEKI
tara:strand:+ start:7716 stop:8447 length:732 start_codon:yes stop_codon:yes gene_type:complete